MSALPGASTPTPASETIDETQGSATGLIPVAPPGDEFTDATSRTKIKNSTNQEPVYVAGRAGSGPGFGLGVRGHCNTGVGLDGSSDTATGVVGYSNEGVAVEANCPQGIWLWVSYGHMRFSDMSGVATIPTGATSVTVTPDVDVPATAYVLLTPRVNIGGRSLWYTTQPVAGTIRIHIGSARTSPT